MAQYVLMNQNIEVARIEYHDEISAILSIDERMHMEYAPLRVTNARWQKISELKAFNEWFKGRGIPSWRDDLERILANLGVEAPEELLNRAFALSLSDQYWLKPVEMDVKWSQINFFEHDFKGADFADATFRSPISGEAGQVESLPRLEQGVLIDFMTPNNTSDGMLKKAWLIREGRRMLVKGGYKNSRQEPLNEKLASMVCEALGFDYVPYEVDVYKGNLVSLCPCFITPDTELLSAHDIYFSKKKPNHKNDYEFYIEILEEHGISDARMQMENMLVLDYLLMNEDRHTRNFGVIRNVKTLEWESVAPLFDTGQALNSQRELLEFDFNRGSGKLFSDVSCDFEKMLSLVRDLRRFDIDALKPVTAAWKALLYQWRHMTKMEDRKIEMLARGFETRVRKLSRRS